MRFRFPSPVKSKRSSGPPRRLTKLCEPSTAWQESGKHDRVYSQLQGSELTTRSDAAQTVDWAASPIAGWVRSVAGNDTQRLRASTYLEKARSFALAHSDPTRSSMQGTALSVTVLRQ